MGDSHGKHGKLKMILPPLDQVIEGKRPQIPSAETTRPSGEHYYSFWGNEYPRQQADTLPKAMNIRDNRRILCQGYY